MKKLKRMIACLLTAATLAGLLVLPSAAAQRTAFTDISDPKMAEAAEVLRVMGVVDGTGGGAFQPTRTLTRAEFCKMVIEIMGKGDEEPAQRNRTIFFDVKSTHWARGYINLAASTPAAPAKEGVLETKLIMGAGDGNFYPERVITYGEAVTILMRVLGYTNSDVATGATWYDGYVAIAKSSGLGDGLTLSGGDAITRGQAAILFYNLLFTKSKDSDDIYLTKLGGKKQDGGILLSVDAVAADGTKGSVKTSTGNIYKTDRVPLDPSLEGLRGDVLLDKDGKLLAFQADENVTRRSISVSGSPKADRITASNGDVLEISLNTVVYKGEETTTYEKVWQDIRSGTALTFYYTSDGKLDYVFYQSVSTAESAMVAKNKPNGTTNPFGTLVSGQTNYTIYKNGIPATVADIRQYDVATYDAAAKILNVSDLRLTGVYENVYPNTESPSKVTVLGHEYPLLSGAARDLQSFKIGDPITLLFTRDGQVAGVVSTSAAKSTAVGVVKEINEATGEAEVELLNDIIGPLTGKTSLTGTSATKMVGQLVTVSSGKVGQISLSKLSGGVNAGTLNVGARTMGNTSLADNVRIYERIGNGKPFEVKLSQITCTTVPSSKILYAGKDYAGKISVLVLDDVTGDLYTYGYLSTGSEVTGAFGGQDIYNPYVSVKTDGKTASDGWKNEDGLKLYGTADVRTNTPGGIAASLDTFNSGKKLAGYVTLQKLEGVRRSDFDMDAKTVTTSDMVLPISEHVVCYNKSTDKFFEADDPMDALNQARAFSDDITIYYDKAPEDGGKVRMVVVE